MLFSAHAHPQDANVAPHDNPCLPGCVFDACFAQLWLITEFCEAGSLLDVMRFQNAALAEPEIAGSACVDYMALNNIWIT